MSWLLAKGHDFVDNIRIGFLWFLILFFISLSVHEINSTWCLFPGSCEFFILKNLIFCFVSTAYSRDDSLTMTVLLSKSPNQTSNFELFKLGHNIYDVTSLSLSSMWLIILSSHNWATGLPPYHIISSFSISWLYHTCQALQNPAKLASLDSLLQGWKEVVESLRSMVCGQAK